MDGVPGTPFTKTGEIDETTGDLAIGRDIRGGCETRKCAQIIDEVMIWNRALSEDEVKLIMAGGKIAFAVDPNDKLASKWGAIKSEF